jgi:hypothetical protein
MFLLIQNLLCRAALKMLLKSAIKSDDEKNVDPKSH